ncbi:MAG TPA: hypothetical protein VF607_16660, partial [Verrucomicrobiae bacterium]
PDRNVKYRPFEAQIFVPGAYLMIALAELRFVQDKDLLERAQFEGRHGRSLAYRLGASKDTRHDLKRFANALDDLKKLGPNDQIPTNTLRAQQLRLEMLANGVAFEVDEATGILTKFTAQGLQASIENFQWVTNNIDAKFSFPEGTLWDDQTSPWSAAELDDCIMAAHDHMAAAGDEKLRLDNYIINLKSGKSRRVPYEGYLSMAGCFLEGRRQVAVIGYSEEGFMGLVKVDLNTGENTPVCGDVPERTILYGAQLSPDKKKLATIQMANSGNILDFQIRTVDLEMCESRLLSKPARVGGPYSWLPDGSGIILPRFERTLNPFAPEPTVICRMDIEGRLTDLRSGRSPLVLPKAGKILYQDKSSDLWQTCELDGSKPQLFAGGLKHHGCPAVSPDGSKIVFTRFEDGKLPQLMLFEMGKSEGKAVPTGPGFTSLAVW